MKTKTAAVDDTDTAALLLDWYDIHHRILPWRVAPRKGAARPDPYRVWLSEIMLQQTQVGTVRRYFSEFIAKWPDVKALGAASRDEVMAAWAGLGYYSRARNLKKCAEIVAFERDGEFPATASELKQLPGIGDYTSAAIAAIAFDQPEPVVDGNVERVFSRYHAIETPPREAKPAIRGLVRRMLARSRPGDFAQATMDLGAMICTPRRPACMHCPLNAGCGALAAGDPEVFPVKAEKREKPIRRGAAFVAISDDGSVLLGQRPDDGLLGGMSEVPTTGWTSRTDGSTDISAAPLVADWRKAGSVRHVFTHFTLELTVYRAEGIGRAPPAGRRWVPQNQLGRQALPTVFRKVLELAVPGATLRPR